MIWGERLPCWQAIPLLYDQLSYTYGFESQITLPFKSNNHYLIKKIYAFPSNSGYFMLLCVLAVITLGKKYSTCITLRVKQMSEEISKMKIKTYHRNIMQIVKPEYSQYDQFTRSIICLDIRIQRKDWVSICDDSKWEYVEITMLGLEEYANSVVMWRRRCQVSNVDKQYNVLWWVWPPNVMGNLHVRYQLKNDSMRQIKFEGFPHYASYCEFDLVIQNARSAWCPNIYSAS